jgi:hypothetical protein
VSGFCWLVCCALFCDCELLKSTCGSSISRTCTLSKLDFVRKSEGKNININWYLRVCELKHTIKMNTSLQ